MKSKLLTIISVPLAIILQTLTLVPYLHGQSPETRTEPPVARSSELILAGKLFCSLKRPVIVYFPGEVTALEVHPGQKVTAGEVLTRYRLSPEAVLQINRRLNPPQIKDLEVKLRDVERQLTGVTEKFQGIEKLARQNLASPQSLRQAEREKQILSQQRAALQEQLAQERQQAQGDLVVLQKQAGTAIQGGHVPREVALKAPIDGYVIWVNPLLREGAELKPNEIACLVGVMNPLVLRAQAHEIEAMQIAVGDVAEVYLEALPNRKFEAKVNQIHWTPATLTVEQPSYYEVEFQVPNPDLVMKEGLKARIVIPKSQ